MSRYGFREVNLWRDRAEAAEAKVADLRAVAEELCGERDEARAAVARGFALADFWEHLSTTDRIEHLGDDARAIRSALRGEGQ